MELIRYRGQELIDCLAQLSRLLSLLPLSDNEVEDVVEGDRIQRESCPRIREPLCHSQGFILSREDLGLPISPEVTLLPRKETEGCSSLGSTKLNPYFISSLSSSSVPIARSLPSPRIPILLETCSASSRLWVVRKTNLSLPQIDKQTHRLSPRYWVEACRGLV